MQFPLPYLSQFSHVQNKNNNFWHQLPKLSQSSQLRGTAPNKTALTSNTSHKLSGSQATWNFLPTSYKSRGFHDLLKFDNSLRWLRKTLYTKLKFYHKGYINEEQRTWVKGCIQSSVPSPHVLGMYYLPGILMYSPTRKLHWALESKVFIGGFFQGHNWLYHWSGCWLNPQLPSLLQGWMNLTQLKDLIL